MNQLASLLKQWVEGTEAEISQTIEERKNDLLKFSTDEIKSN